MTEDGEMTNSSFLDYRMPTSLDLPMIDTILVEVANPLHPFGVRGVAEVPLVPPLGAVSNAVADATGTRFTDAPIKPWQDRGRHGRWKRIVEPERLHGPGFHTIQPA